MTRPKDLQHGVRLRAIDGLKRFRAPLAVWLSLSAGAVPCFGAPSNEEGPAGVPSSPSIPSAQTNVETIGTSSAPEHAGTPDPEPRLEAPASLAVPPGCEPEQSRVRAVQERLKRLDAHAAPTHPQTLKRLRLELLLTLSDEEARLTHCQALLALQTRSLGLETMTLTVRLEQVDAALELLRLKQELELLDSVSLAELTRLEAESTLLTAELAQVEHSHARAWASLEALLPNPNEEPGTTQQARALEGAERNPESPPGGTSSSAASPARAPSGASKTQPPVSSGADTGPTTADSSADGEEPGITIRAQEEVALHLDGILNEVAWTQATCRSGLTRLVPTQGEPGFGSVRFCIFQDDKALYVGARVVQPEGVLRAHSVPRDQFENEDSFYLILKPFAQGDSAYLLKVNPLGIQRDRLIAQDGNAAVAWDGIWQSAGTPLQDGYSVELRIPFRTLRYPQTGEARWQLAVGVDTASQGITDCWPPYHPSRGPQLQQLAVLRGLKPGVTGPALEVIPSSTVRYGGQGDETGEFQLDAPEFFRLKTPGILDAGVDLRYGLTPSTSMNLTFNPDFSQVEADPGQLDYNLRYPLILPEKRAFFLEGQDVFESLTSLLYTRLINDPVVGAKLVGREGAWSYGILGAYDLDPPPSLVTFDQAAGSQPPSGFEDTTDTSAATLVGRAVRTLSPSTRVGGFFAEKTLVDNETGKARAHHELFALDGRTAFNTLQLSAQAGVSQTQAEGEEPLIGALATLQAGWANKRWGLNAYSRYTTPEFRAETSALTRVGTLSSSLNIQYTQPTQQSWLTYVRPFTGAWLLQDSQSLLRLEGGLAPGMELQLPGNTLSRIVGYFMEESFGGEVFRYPLVEASVSTNPVATVQGTCSLSAGQNIYYDPENPFLGQTVGGSASVTLRPLSQLKGAASWTKSLFFSPSGEKLFDVDIVRGDVSYIFSSRWSANLISELNTWRAAVESRLLISYLYSPGTAFYLGIQDQEPIGETSSTQTERSVFLKASYVWPQ